MINIPQRHVAAVDLVDEVLATLRTIYAAMNEPREIGEDELVAMASVLFGAMRQLQPVREMINEQHGAA
jgi:pyrimidine operon attenuation protein/uracil phosphoribosyltransferase